MSCLHDWTKFRTLEIVPGACNLDMFLFWGCLYPGRCPSCRVSIHVLSVNFLKKADETLITECKGSRQNSTRGDVETRRCRIGMRGGSEGLLYGDVISSAKGRWEEGEMIKIIEPPCFQVAVNLEQGGLHHTILTRY